MSLSWPAFRSIVSARAMCGFIAFLLNTCALAVSTVTIVQAQEKTIADSHVVSIDLAHGTEAETITAAQLRTLLGKYDVDPWILTRRVLIDEEQIPHSHPVLTLHTGHIGEEFKLLSTFVHEQLHWLEDGSADFAAAMKDFDALFPDVPSHADGGAFDEQSTYRHLLVCELEYQAMTSLVGKGKARETLAAMKHYEWIYDKVLNDPRVHEVALRHRFDVSAGVPGYKQCSIAQPNNSPGRQPPSSSGSPRTPVS